VFGSSCATTHLLWLTQVGEDAGNLQTQLARAEGVTDELRGQVQRMQQQMEAMVRVLLVFLLLVGNMP
jgi:TolA-binding protein